MKKAKVSKYGQWKYPGQDTIIPNANGSITMKGVPYPVLGIDDQGNQQMMMPGAQYQFPGNSVYEIPMAKKGGTKKVKIKGLPKAQGGTEVPPIGVPPEYETIKITDPNDPRYLEYLYLQNLYNWSNLQDFDQRDLFKDPGYFYGNVGEDYKYAPNEYTKDYTPHATQYRNGEAGIFVDVDDPTKGNTNYNSDETGYYGSKANEFNFATKAELDRWIRKNQSLDPGIYISHPTYTDERQYWNEILTKYQPIGYDAMIDWNEPDYGANLAADYDPAKKRWIYKKPATQFIEDNIDRAGLRKIYPYLTDKELDEYVKNKRLDPDYITNALNPVTKRNLWIRDNTNNNNEDITKKHPLVFKQPQYNTYDNDGNIIGKRDINGDIDYAHAGTPGYLQEAIIDWKQTQRARYLPRFGPPESYLGKRYEYEDPKKIEKQELIQDGPNKVTYTLHHTDNGGGVAYVHKNYRDADGNYHSDLLGSTLTEEWMTPEQQTQFDSASGGTLGVEFNPNAKIYSDLHEPLKIIDDRRGLKAKGEALHQKQVSQVEAEKAAYEQYQQQLRDKEKARQKKIQEEIEAEKKAGGYAYGGAIDPEKPWRHKSKSKDGNYLYNRVGTNAIQDYDKSTVRRTLKGFITGAPKPTKTPDTKYIPAKFAMGGVPRAQGLGDIKLNIPTNLQQKKLNTPSINFNPQLGFNIPKQFELGDFTTHRVPSVYNAVKSGDPHSMEEAIDKYFGYPQDRAFQYVDSRQEGDNDPSDNERHGAAGLFTQQAIKNKIDIPIIGDAAGWLGANAMGIGHELGTMFEDERPWGDKLQEAGEDIFNNFAGSTLGILPGSQNEKLDILHGLSVGNWLPDGVVWDGGKNNLYLKDEQGNVNRDSAMDMYNRMFQKKQGGVIKQVRIKSLPKAQKMGQFKPSYDWRVSPAENAELNRRAELAGHNSVDEYRASGWAWQPEKTHFTQGTGQGILRAQPQTRNWEQQIMQGIPAAPPKAKSKTTTSSSSLKADLKKMNQDLISGSYVAESTFAEPRIPIHWVNNTPEGIKAIEDEWERVRQEGIAEERAKIQADNAEINKRKQQFAQKYLGTDISQVDNYEKDNNTGEWAPKSEHTKQLEAKGKEQSLRVASENAHTRNINTPTVGEELTDLALELPFALLGTGAYSQAFKMLKGAKRAAPGLGALAPETSILDDIIGKSIQEAGASNLNPTEVFIRNAQKNGIIPASADVKALVDNPNLLNTVVTRGIKNNLTVARRVTPSAGAGVAESSKGTITDLAKGDAAALARFTGDPVGEAFHMGTHVPRTAYGQRSGLSALGNDVDALYFDAPGNFARQERVLPNQYGDYTVTSRIPFEYSSDPQSMYAKYMQMLQETKGMSGGKGAKPGDIFGRLHGAGVEESAIIGRPGQQVLEPVSVSTINDYNKPIAEFEELMALSKEDPEKFKAAFWEKYNSGQIARTKEEAGISDSQMFVEPLYGDVKNNPTINDLKFALRADAQNKQFALKGAAPIQKTNFSPLTTNFGNSAPVQLTGSQANRRLATAQKQFDVLNKRGYENLTPNELLDAFRLEHEIKTLSNPVKKQGGSKKKQPGFQVLTDANGKYVFVKT